jgi:Mg/Co/Ni transporter MgtE
MTRDTGEADSRVFWLLIVVFGNLFSGAGIAYYEETVVAYIALAFFLPRPRASAPLVTSISDAAGILIYLSIATAMLRTPPVAG